MSPVLKTRNDLTGPKIVEALEKRHFEAYYCSTKEDALNKALDLIPENTSVAWGGSITVEQVGIIDGLYKRNKNNLIDRDKVSTAEEKWDKMHEALNSDYFLMSSNAITQQGELFNVDGNANRVAALCYGPKNVIIVAGMNKIVKDIDAAYSRVRNYAAPVNAQRFNIQTPCKLTGMCADCTNIQSICAQMVTTRFCRPQGRIKVILVGEDLGF